MSLFSTSNFCFFYLEKQIAYFLKAASKFVVENPVHIFKTKLQKFKKFEELLYFFSLYDKLTRKEVNFKKLKEV